MTTYLGPTSTPVRAPRRSGPPGCHIVQFYADEAELAEGVAGYLCDGIQDGDLVIVVATARHREAFDVCLVARGIDVAAARASGSYVVLDAEATMHQFLVADRPDPARFEATVGRLLRQALSTGRPVRGYGEMVALLWEAGQVEAALELEGLWNSLASQLTVLLYCAYRSQAVAGDELTEVCRLHSAVVGRPAATSASPSAPAPGRDDWITII